MAVKCVLRNEKIGTRNGEYRGRGFLVLVAGTSDYSQASPGEIVRRSSETLSRINVFVDNKKTDYFLLRLFAISLRVSNFVGGERGPASRKCPLFEETIYLIERLIYHF